MFHSFNNFLRISRLKNAHLGGTAFIIGNGPSLKAKDLNLIHQNNIPSFASNKIYKIFDKTNWRPSYFVIEDYGICSSNFAEIQEKIHCTIFAGDYLAKFFQKKTQPLYFKQLERVIPPRKPAFSKSITQGINSGGTVTYTCIQIACFLGFTDLILLGVDFDYSTPDLRPHDTFMGYNTYTPNNKANYFDSNYLDEKENIFAPDLETSYCAYLSVAEKIKSGTLKCKVRNATRGGKLEIFKRVDFDSIF
jgi:hypothetical protein